MPDEMTFTIGALAHATGATPQIIRHYEAIGLLPPAARSAGNQRRYGIRHRERLAFIRHARELGFGLEAIRELLHMADHPEQSCEAADRLARRRLEEVESRLVRLQALKAELERMIEECRGGRVAECRVIESLADHRHCLSDAHLTEPDPTSPPRSATG